MIRWMDFVFDEVGPLLEDSDCRRTRLESSSVMDDARVKKPIHFGIQETGQEQWPARMVGLASSDYSPARTDAERTFHVDVLRPGEEG